MSITSSWPTTALPTSLRIASVKPRMSRTSIDHLPLPSENVARQHRELRARAAPARGPLLPPAPPRAAVDLRVTHAGGPAQPVDQSGIRQTGGRMQLPRHVLHDRMHVALDDDRPVTREVEQVGGRLDQAALAGFELDRR